MGNSRDTVRDRAGTGKGSYLVVFRVLVGEHVQNRLYIPYLMRK